MLFIMYLVLLSFESVDKTCRRAEIETTLRAREILIRFTHCYFCHELSLKVSGTEPGFDLTKA